MTRKRLFTEKTNTQPDKDYGPEASDPVDINEVELKRLCELRLLKFQVDTQKIVLIEKQTVGQHDNEKYLSYRSDRLTASQFGMVRYQPSSYCFLISKKPQHMPVQEL